MVLRKLVVAHSVHQAGLANATVPDHDQLEKLVLLQAGRTAALSWNDLVLELFDRSPLNLVDFLGLLRGEATLSSIALRHLSTNLIYYIKLPN